MSYYQQRILDPTRESGTTYTELITVNLSLEQIKELAAQSGAQEPN
jgi:hypothetical protein